MAETTSKASPKKVASKTKATSRQSVAGKAAAVPVAAVAKNAPKNAPKKAPAKTAVSPTEKAAPAKKRVAAKAPAPEMVAGASATANLISDELRYRMVAEAAYFRAESRQFKSDPVRDWIEAEAEVAARLSSGKLSPQGQ